MKTMKQNYTKLLAIIGFLAAAGCTDDAQNGKKLTCEAGLTVCGNMCCDGTCTEGVCSTNNSGNNSQSGGTNETGCSNNQTLCDGSCFNLNTTAKHCGDCDTACEDGEICSNGKCTTECNNGYSACGTSCVDTTRDNENCGGCGITCAGNMYCAESQCQCPSNTYDCDDDASNGCESTVRCDIACEDGKESCGPYNCVDKKTDVNNCGSCGNTCDTDFQCIEGACMLVCSGATPDKCEDQKLCVNFASDNENCGSCGNECSSREYCSNGECVPNELNEADCEEGQEVCWNTCTPVNNDVKNCGSCGNACGDSEICEYGECKLVCKADQIECAEACVDPNSNDHCGDCDNMCEDNEYCSNKECVPNDVECPDNQIACHNVCVDTTSDINNCGACNRGCASDQTCEAGDCVDQPVVVEPTKCYGVEVDLMTDDKNCGECLNACGTSEKCEAGQCVLQCGDLTKCDGACYDIQTSANHCGGCNKVCKAGQECNGADCQCLPGYYDCDKNPNNGCESTVACSCNPGEKRACWNGSADNRNKGICKDGTQTCDASGRFWSSCVGAVYPSFLTCNDAGLYYGGDQNCNGIDDTTEDCRSNCDLRLSDSSYIGCEYWAAFLQNYNGYYNVYMDMTLVISNPSDTETAEVYVWDKAAYTSSTTSNMKPYLKVSVPPNSVIYKTIVGTPSGSNNSNAQKSGTTIYDYMMYKSMLAPRAFKVRSSIPVVIYQFNPYGKSQGYTADASLLLPSNTLGNDYMNLTYYGSSGDVSAPVISVIATEPGTTKVTVKPTIGVKQGTDGSSQTTGNTAFAAITANTEKEITMNQFDILTLQASEAGEMTGSTIKSNKKISVFGGSACATIRSACDHVEEQLFPTTTWGSNYYAIRAGYNHSYKTILGSEPDDYYILAQQNGTVVSIYGNQGTQTTDTITLNAYTGSAGSKTLTSITTNNSFRGSVTLNAGQFTKITTVKNFEISATKPILVGQFIDDVNSIGDPGFMLNVPVQQYRKDYSFSIPENYEYDFVTLVAPKGTKIYYTGSGYKGKSYTNTLIDSLPLTVFSGWKDIGSNNYVYGYLDLDKGTHKLVSDQKFGATGYGFGDANSSTDDTSYAYPIGLNLDKINKTN